MFSFVQFQCLLQNILYWSFRFTKCHHYSIMPNKFGNIMFNCYPFCFKRSSKLFSSTNKSILIIIITNLVPKYGWSLANTYCGVLQNMQKIARNLLLLHCNKVLPLFVLHGESNLENIYNIFASTFCWQCLCKSVFGAWYWIMMEKDFFDKTSIYLILGGMCGGHSHMFFF